MQQERRRLKTGRGLLAEIGLALLMACGGDKAAAPLVPPVVVDTQAPSVPSGLTASAITATGLTLSWTASSDNAAVTGYRVYRNAAATPIATVPSGVTFADTGLTANTPYTYAVDAIDAAGNASAKTSVVNVTTANTVPTTPVISAFTASPTTITTGGSSTLAWTVTGATSLSIGNTVGTAVGTVTGTSRVVTPTATTLYTLTATNTAGNSTATATAGNSTATATVTVTTGTTDTTPPSAPTNLAATNLSATGVTLSWTASTDNVAVTGYRVYRGTATAPIATVTGTAFTDTGLTASTAYSYAVDAIDAGGNASPKSTALNVTTTAQVADPLTYSKAVRIHNSPHQFSITLHAYAADSDQLTFEIVQGPQHGTYFLEPSPQLATQTVRTNALRYTPNIGFVGADPFTFRVRDPQGNVSSISTVALEVLAPVATPYLPPIGIPKPEFGIEESHTMYAGQTYSYNGTPGPYKDAGNGPYTHYVDNTHAAATDTNNPYGTADKPRLTFPVLAGTTTEPGAVIEVHGGPYLLSGQSQVRYTGSVEKPLFVRGVGGNSKPILRGGEWLLRGHHMIWENLTKEMRITSRIVQATDEAHHVAFRHCKVLGSLGGVSYLPNTQVHNLVFYDNDMKVADFDPNGPSFPEDDTVGVYCTQRTTRVWVLDSDIYQSKGDCVGGGHGVQYTASNYYFGRNLMHETGENAVDLKEVENIIVSQNKMYDFKGLSLGNGGGGGGAIVVHYGPTYSPRNVWFLFNEIYNATGCAISVGGDQEHPVYFIGNIIHDIKNATHNAKAFQTWGCHLVALIGNTIYNTDLGIDWGVQNNAQLVFEDNIISTMTSGGYHVRVESTNQQQLAEINRNLFHQPNGNANITWGGGSRTLAQWQAASGKGASCLEGDPRFVNATTKDFHLQAGSPALGKGAVAAVYQLFQDTFGMNIRVDYDGKPRPTDGPWAIGPFELVP
ncbi:MAG: fibronectin type III domain-containing protein [Holophaga sp.]|nr:fibronectin type III domain-containing protein [Holophaga sp.]